MLAVLDPVLFDDRAPVRPRALDALVRLLQRERARIPDARWYWNTLQQKLIRPLGMQPEYRESLDRLRDFARPVSFPTAPARVSVWSVRQMFGPLGPAWVDIMERVLTGAVLTGEPTVLLTHLREKRNLTTHRGPGECTVREKTCWNVRVQPAGHELVRIPVVCRVRNLDLPWTCRFDDRLPADADDADYPFCPPLDWHKASVAAVHTHESRPTWRDGKGNHWARPATGGGHHWDVYLSRALAAEHGLGQLNITQWGAPKGEGAAGSLHHVPRKKRSRRAGDAGWSC